MPRLIKKFKLQIIIICAALSLIFVSAVISGVHRGHRPITSLIEKTEAVKVSDSTELDNLIKNNIGEDIFLPEKYKSNGDASVSITKYKKYTDCKIDFSQCEIMLRCNNYANLVEDEAVRIPKNSEKFNLNGIDIFVFENKDGTSSAVYYDGLTLVRITDKCSYDELKMEIIERSEQ